MREWRAKLKQPELPFLLVELAAYKNCNLNANWLWNFLLKVQRQWRIAPEK